MPRRPALRLPVLDDHDPAEAALRPKTRAACLPGGVNAQRPCPWAGCRFHLGLDASPVTGSVKLHIDPEQLGQAPETCALDVAARAEAEGGLVLEQIGAALNLTRERIRQIEAWALARIQRTKAGREALAELAEHLQRDP